MTVFALVHSPLVGPFTWGLVAGELRRAGVEVVVPSLVDAHGAGAPYWQQHAASAARALESVPADRSLAWVGHSGTGALLPVMRQMTPHRAASYLFVDAGLPADGASRLDQLALESPEFAEQFRQALAAGERFPAWRDEDLAEIIPEATLRQSLLAELRPRSLAFFEEPIPVFADWPDAPCGYLQFTSTYDVFGERARLEGWPYRKIDAGHFHMLVDPKAVADALLDLTERMP